MGSTWLVAAMLGACQGREPDPLDPHVATATELYGLQVGAKWTYLRTNDVLRWKEITACEDTVVLDPTTGEPTLVRTYVRENRSETGTTSVHYLVVDEEGVKRVRRDDVDGGQLAMFATYDPASPRIYEGPYTDGMEWNFALNTAEFNPRDSASRGSSLTSAVDVAFGVEDVVVMAGTYATLGVDREWDAFNAHTVRSFYAPGVGEVHERTEWPDVPLPRIQIEELVAYTPGYGSCDGGEPLFDVPCDVPLRSCDNPWGNAARGCTDPRVDPANCGACGEVCESGVCAGGACVEAACALECEGATACCSNAWGWGIEGCTSPSRDRWNCGACGEACDEGLICDHGTCTCAPGTADCGTGACADVLEDPENCGTCGNACGGDTPICDSGVCVAACLSVDLEECGGECVDLGWDSRHCGACGVECGDGHGSLSCANGACVTCGEAGLADCSGDCADLDWSDKHCGACGRACGSDEVCISGECTAGDGSCADVSCPSGSDICCGGQCVDPRTSDTHCGGCGVSVCGSGCTEACRDGVCTLVDCGGGDD